MAGVSSTCTAKFIVLTRATLSDYTSSGSPLGVWAEPTPLPGLCTRRAGSGHAVEMYWATAPERYSLLVFCS